MFGWYVEMSLRWKTNVLPFHGVLRHWEWRLLFPHHIMPYLILFLWWAMCSVRWKGELDIVQMGIWWWPNKAGRSLFSWLDDVPTSFRWHWSFPSRKVVAISLPTVWWNVLVFYSLFHACDCRLLIRCFCVVNMTVCQWTQGWLCVGGGILGLISLGWYLNIL